MLPRSSHSPSFDEIASTLRSELVEHLAPDLVGPAGWISVDTNSTLAESRGRLIADQACERLGIDSLEGTRLADLGCGFGSLAALFAFEGAHVVAIDSNRPRLEVAAHVATSHGLDIEVLASRMERLDLPDASFDIAVMNNSLVYLVDDDDRRRALAEAFRVLVPGGVLIMRNANRLYPIDQFTGLPAIHLLPPATAVRAARRLGRPRSYCRLFTPGATRRELLDAGYVEPLRHAAVVRRWALPGVLSRYTHVSALRPR
jgi:SAM-dependent methyltransferase